MKLNVKCNKKNKMANHANPFTSQAQYPCTELASQMVDRQAIKSTNKPYPVVKNMYYIPTDCIYTLPIGSL